MKTKKKVAPSKPLFDAAEEMGPTKERTSVKALQHGKICGWCGKRHEALKCP